MNSMQFNEKCKIVVEILLCSTFIMALLLITFVPCFVGCATISPERIDYWDYEKTKQADTVSSYSYYLTEHPNGKYIQDAQKRIEELKELQRAEAERLAELKRIGLFIPKIIKFVSRIDRWANEPFKK